MKKVLSLEDLENFYSNHKRSTHFNAEESGYKIAVHVPTTFEVYDSSDDTMLFVKCRVFHIGLNRNKSSVTEDAAKKAMKTMAYKPLLANFTDVNGELDFTSHDFYIDPNDEDSLIYEEKQIGCITADEPWFEEDDELDKKYICAYIAIPREYTKAAEIIERKNGTKVSVELIINDLSYNCQEQCLQLNDVTVQGLTALGTDPETGKAVEEGMLGSKITLKDFSESNNSLFSSISEEDKEKLIEMQTTINDMVERFNINQAEESAEENSKEGGNDKVTKFEELLQKYNKTEDDIQFEIEGLSDEELEAKFAEVFGEESNEDPTSEEGETTTENFDDGSDSGDSSDGDSADGDDTTDDNTDSEADDSESDEDSVATLTDDAGVADDDENDEDDEDKVDKDDASDVSTKKGKFEKSFEIDGRSLSISFELSHEDVKYALYNLIEQYMDLDNDYYDVIQVFDDYFVMQGWFSGKIYGQKYTKDGEAVALDGERYELFAELLTATEKAELESMRSNYSLATEKLAAYEKAELNAQKEEILADENYAEFAETNSFKQIRENLENYSLDELKTAAELAFAKEVKAKGTFALHEEIKKAPVMFAFAKQETKSSFLDGLLGK